MGPKAPHLFFTFVAQSRPPDPLRHNSNIVSLFTYFLAFPGERHFINLVGPPVLVGRLVRNRETERETRVQPWSYYGREDALDNLR